MPGAVPHAVILRAPGPWPSSASPPAPRPPPPGDLDPSGRGSAVTLSVVASPLTTADVPPAFWPQMYGHTRSPRSANGHGSVPYSRALTEAVPGGGPETLWHRQSLELRYEKLLCPSPRPTSSARRGKNGAKGRAGDGGRGSRPATSLFLGALSRPALPAASPAARCHLYVRSQGPVVFF